MDKQIKNALISVYHKDNLEDIVRRMQELGIAIYSTGGTQKFIEELGVEVHTVEDLTGYPSIFGGRVKTLHPKVFGGILHRRELQDDVMQAEEYEIPPIDMVIVDLYPFEETVANSSDPSAIIEKIDIGGISLIRAAAKNYKDVLIVSSRDQYTEVWDLLNEREGFCTEAERQRFAAEAFAISSNYDTAIYSWFNRNSGLEHFRASETSSTVLRYGENPHQKGWFHGNLDDVFDQLNGKALSYNNLVDIDAAVHLIAEFEDTTFAILKHTNSCGCASRSTLVEAYEAALAGDPVSAFGGILVTNRIIDMPTAEKIHELFCEVLIAPDYEPAALDLLKGKKNRILLKQKVFDFGTRQFKTLLNGVILQEKDLAMESGDQMEVVTEKKPTDNESADLSFALKLVKHLKSNTIVLARNNQLLGMGCGQTSRVDALKQAIEKAKAFGFELDGAVMASDAFFPFNDCVQIADEAGITSVVQPGGSIRDQDSIDYCNSAGMSMVTTGVRHFKH